MSSESCLQPKDSLECLAFAGPNRLLAGGWDGLLRLWSLPDGICQLELGDRLPEPDPAQGLIISFGSTGVASVVVRQEQALASHSDGGLRLWDLGSGGQQRYFQESPAWQRPLVDAGLLDTEYVFRRGVAGSYLYWLADGRRVLEAGINHGPNLWDMGNGLNIWHLHRGSGPLAVHPDQRRAVCQGPMGGALLLDIRSGNALAHWQEETSMRVLTFTPRGQLVAGTWEQLQILDPETGQTLRELPHEAVNALAWHPNSGAIGVTDSGQVLVWDHEFRLQKQWETQSQLRAVAVSPDGNRVAWAGSQGAFWSDWDQL